MAALSPAPLVAAAVTTSTASSIPTGLLPATRTVTLTPTSAMVTTGVTSAFSTSTGLLLPLPLPLLRPPLLLQWYLPLLPVLPPPLMPSPLPWLLLLPVPLPSPSPLGSLLLACCCHPFRCCCSCWCCCCYRRHQQWHCHRRTIAFPVIMHWPCTLRGHATSPAHPPSRPWVLLFQKHPTQHRVLRSKCCIAHQYLPFMFIIGNGQTFVHAHIREQLCVCFVA